MLPVYRNQEYLFSVPKFEMTEEDAESFMDALKAFHGQFHDCFHRSETRENVFQYMSLLQNSKRKLFYLVPVRKPLF